MAFEFLEELRNLIEYKSQIPSGFEETAVAFLNYGAALNVAHNAGIAIKMEALGAWGK